MLTREQIAATFGLDDERDSDGNPVALDAETLDRLEAVQAAGKWHGEAGFYPDGEFGSDADWIYGIGAEIRELEELLEDDFGTVFDLYSEAHSEHFEEPQDGDPTPYCNCGECSINDVTCVRDD